MVLRSGLRILFAGLAFGGCCAVWLGGLVQSMWHGVSPTDPIMLAGSTAVLLVAGLAAAALPARQASRVDPMLTLRND